MSAAPRSSAKRSPSPCDHGFARSRSGAAGWMCSATSSSEAANPPVARITGPSGICDTPKRTSRASSSVSPRGSKRFPTVLGLPVSSQTTGAPSETSHAIASSSRSQTIRCSVSSPSGHSRRKSSHSRWRQTTQDESSIEPPARVPFSVCSTSQPSSRRRAAATRPAIPAPATATPELTSARTSACARRTRCARARGPTGTRRTCSRRRRPTRLRSRAPAPRRRLRPPSRRAARGD